MMRSMASPRAVSISTGMSDMARSWRQTSRPSMSGSIRSRITASMSPAVMCSSAARPLGACVTRKAAWLRYSVSISARRGSSSTSRIWSGMGFMVEVHADHSTDRRPASQDGLAVTSMAVVHLAQVVGHLLALGRRKGITYVGQQLHDALRRLVGQRHTLRAGGFQRRAVDGGGRHLLDQLLVDLWQLLVQWLDVGHGGLDQRLDLGLLRIGGVDFDIQVLEHALHMGAGVDGGVRPAHA